MSESGQPRPPLRAKDSDREAVVDVLNGAFVDGQLDQDEHQRRVDVALAAPTVGSLSVLTADLQLSADVFRDLSAKGLVPHDPAPAPTATPAPSGTTVSTGTAEPVPTKLVWAKGRLAALAVVVLLIAGNCVGNAVISGDRADDSGFADPDEFGQSGLVLDEAYLDDFITSYEARFKTTDVVSVESEEDGLLVIVPVAGRAAGAAYAYADGVFTKVPGTGAADDRTVDLADLDTAVIGGLPDLAVEELGVDDPEQVDLFIGQTPAGPGVRVSVTGDDGVVTMTTDMDGRVTSSSP